MDKVGLESYTRSGNVVSSASEDKLLGTVYVEKIKLELQQFSIPSTISGNNDSQSPFCSNHL